MHLQQAGFTLGYWDLGPVTGELTQAQSEFQGIFSFIRVDKRAGLQPQASVQQVGRSESRRQGGLTQASMKVKSLGERCLLLKMAFLFSKLIQMVREIHFTAGINF